LKEKRRASVTIQEAQARLPELVHRLSPEEEVVIIEDEQPVTRLVKSAPQPSVKRRLGTMKGSVLYMAPDFDAPLDDFRESME
jgi:antitoxin (DNA-binding transcriptional repressor) of toxin-antitoxin stability system